MYTEVRPAFNDWRKAREAVANSLPANQARSYREYTRVMTNAIFKTIKGLDWVEFRPARPESVLAVGRQKYRSTS